MATPYVGEIRQWAGNFAPVGWAYCDGSLVKISDYDVLFNLIGTTYGGDGQQNFGLPNLQGRVPVHMGTNGEYNYALGNQGGSTQVTLTTNQLPQHTHVPVVAAASSADTPTGNVWATATGSAQPYGPPPAINGMNPASIGVAGSSQPHENMIPYQAITYIISLYGVYPSPY
jgi:microcystin-dependent protein